MKVFPRLGMLALFLFFCVNIAAAAGEPYRDPTRPVDERVRDLLERMSLEEKIDQLTQKGADKIEMQEGVADEASLQKLFGDRSIGVLCVKFGDDLCESARRLSAGQKYLREQTRLGIPALTVNEGLHGVLARGATIYPQTTRSTACRRTPTAGCWRRSCAARWVPVTMLRWPFVPQRPRQSRPKIREQHDETSHFREHAAP